MNNKNDIDSMDKAIDTFLGKAPKIDENAPEMDCTSGTCIIKNDKSVLERINKKIITEDGRQLLI